MHYSRRYQLKLTDVASDGGVWGVNDANQVWRYTGSGWQEILPGATAATAVVAPAAAPGLKDRAVAPMEIQTYFGYAVIQGQIDTGDGIRNGRYVDSYEYRATAEE